MPQARWTMIFLCCLPNTINYADRANLAVAAPSTQRELGIDAAMMGLVLRGFSLAQLGTLGVLPALVAIPGGWLGGFTSDALYRRGWSLTAARKTCLVGGMLMSSAITLSALAPNVYVALLCFAVSYASLAFTAASIWSLPGDVAPNSSHVASIGGIQNFASNLAGIVTTSFTGVMLTITSGSFIVPLVVAGGFYLLGAAAYPFLVGAVAPLPPLLDGASTHRASAAE